MHADAKRMSSAAFTQLNSAHKQASGNTHSHTDPLIATRAQGGEESSPLCQQCLLTHLQGIVAADEKGSQAETMLALISAAEGQVEEGGFFVSKTWLT